MRVGPGNGARLFHWRMEDLRDTRLAREVGPEQRVAALAEPVLADMGFRLVRVKISGPTLQIMAERPDGSFSIDDCTRVSRALSPALDVADILPSRYYLEVSSPGIDRPLVRLGDFERWTGHEAKIELRMPRDGRKRFRGRLEGIADGAVRLSLEPAAAGVEREVVALPFGEIAEAKLMMTDTLVAMTRKKTPGALRDGSEWTAEENEHA
jgi:ribosome maturation factor RimP